MKVQQEAKKEESNLKPESLTDLHVAEEQADDTKGGAGSGQNLEFESFSWSAVNMGSR